MSKKVVLTGGGTAGHVMLHLALIPEMKKRGWMLHYIGSKGIEKDLIEPTDIPFHVISTGKLRRYFSLQNFFDIFKVIIGTLQCFIILVRLRPQLVFSKGGFVSVPVAVAAWLLGIPVVSHESDVTPGLANRIILKFARKVMFSFPDTAKYLPKDKSQYVGTAIRQELFSGDRSRGLKMCGFDESDEVPVVLVMGGSQGSLKINEAIVSCQNSLLSHFRIIHLTGKGKSVSIEHKNYKGFEFVSEELKDLMAASHMCIARAGANSIFEFLALKKPMLLIPLEEGSRGDQVVNAESFAKNNWAIVLREKELSGESLIRELDHLKEKQELIKTAQAKVDLDKSEAKIFQTLEAF